jgi:hypothetical protein
MTRTESGQPTWRQLKGTARRSKPGTVHATFGHIYQQKNMGVRIHKVLGYGFRRAKLDRDPRFPHAIRSLDQAAHEGKLNGKELRPADGQEKGQSPVGTSWKSRSNQKGEKAKPLTYDDVVIYSPFTAEAKPPIGPCSLPSLIKTGSATTTSSTITISLSSG